MDKSVVIVESPAKAKTINKYLGQGFDVLASYGHIRDLSPKDGSVDPEQDFAMRWELDAKASKRVAEIAKAVKGADRLYLATDPDREGEAISWHIQEVLNGKGVLKNVDVNRVVFHEITKDAVRQAFDNPRAVDSDLVEAYLARRALDFLVGFTLSPVLWRKLPGAKSAGRVQSVALRLICEREAEIEAFKPREYWDIEVGLAAEAGMFTARLTHLDGQKLDKFALDGEAKARDAASRLSAMDYAAARIERKQVRRNPAPPFITSTLQQEASRKLGFSVSRTMRTAQRLYEGIDLGGETVGLITYMRTDGTQLSQEAILATRGTIERDFGARYLPDQPRRYATKAKNAQEAHEAIRPTDPGRRPKDIADRLEADQAKLYDLIWKRTMACQMEQAVLDQVTVDVDGQGGQATLRATGSVVVFDGFLTLYQEGKDDAEDEGKGDKRLPAIKDGEALRKAPAALKDNETSDPVRASQHFTLPPPRYSEASLIKGMEELGIGRPSTYSSILQVLQDRDYVRLEKRRFLPEDRGRLVTAFLTRYFEQYVEYGFTAELENKLDDISGGRIDWKAVLRDFWQEFRRHVDETKDLRIGEVIEVIDKVLGPHFFPEAEDGTDARRCPACGATEAAGRLSIKLGKFGAFIGCSNYPECRYTRQLGVSNGEGEDGQVADGPRVLGDDPDSGLEVTVRKGPYGTYVQLGERVEGSKEKPKRVSVPKGLAPMELTLDQGLALLALPREIGGHPETGAAITAGIGRYGPYLRHDGAYCSLGAEDDVLTIGINRAVALLAETKGRRRGGGGASKSLGDHPSDGKPVTLHSGRYGPYVKHANVLASLPKSADAESYTLDEAVALLAAKKQSKGGKSPAKGKAKATTKSAATKPAARKATGGKTTTKRKTAGGGKRAGGGSAAGD